MKKLDVDLKKISRGDTSHLAEAAEAGLLKELWNLMSAKHPNIVSPKGYIGKREQKGEAGLVMELMDTSLTDFLEDEAEPLGDVVMIDLMLEIARGARFLQECGLVHKDLKSQNILLRSTKVRGCWKEYPAAEVKLADFGLTQCIVQDARPSAGTTLTQGTFCYMAPECLKIADLKGHSYEDKVDVFSYGTICFDILACGDPDACQFTSPGGRAKAEELFYKDVKSGKWRERVKGRSGYLVDLIARCWDFDARKRPTFATICSFLQHALRCALSPPVIQVTTLSNFEQNSKSSLLNLYRTITWRSDARYWVIGTTMLDSCLEDFARDVNKGEDLESDLIEDVTLFSEVLNREMTAKPAAETEDVDVGVSSSKQSTTDQRNGMQLKPMKTEDDGVYTPEVVVEVQDQCFRIPFEIMDTEWIVFKALIWSSMLPHFPFLDHERFIQPLLGSDGRLKSAVEPLFTVDKFSFNTDASTLQLDVDAQLVPLLVCFWEGGIKPIIIYEFE